MATVPVTRTWTAGEVVLDSHFNNNIRDVFNFLLAPPIFQGRQTVSQTFTTAVDAAVTIDTEDVDSAGGHSTSVNTSRYTYVYPGWMQWSGKVSFASNTTGWRSTNWGKNGTLQNASGVIQPGMTGGIDTRIAAAAFLMFGNVGDYVEIFGGQASGGNLGSAVGTVTQPFLSGVWESN